MRRVYWLSVLCMLLIPDAPSLADDLGCFVSGGTVRGAFTQFSGTATSVAADVYDYDDLVDGTGYAAPTMTDLGGNNWGAADSTAGATTGLHKVVMVGTVNGVTETGIDTFVVAAACPMPTYTQPSGFLAATFPTTVASTTNITAGTITTATNLTTNNDKTGYATTAADKLAVLTQVSGTADSGSTTTIVDAERTEADTDYWANQCLVPTSGTINGQGRRISAFNATTDTLTVDTAWTQAAGTNTYVILRSALCPATSAIVNLDTATGTLASGQLEDGLFTEPKFGDAFITGRSFVYGGQVADDTGGATVDLGTSGVSQDNQYAFTARAEFYTNTAQRDFLTSACVIASNAANDTVTLEYSPQAIIAINDWWLLVPDGACNKLRPTVDGRTADVSVAGNVGPDFSNIEGTLDAPEVAQDVSDEIWATPGIELSQAAPSATPTMTQAMMALYMCLFRSEVTTTSTTVKCKNDAGTIIFSRSASDDGTTFTRGEMGSGP